MRVYEIALPVKNNAGKDLSGAHAAFQIIVQTQFGGFTKGATAEGSWVDNAGALYQEEMVPYRIAVDAGHAANEPGVMSTLAGIASGLFPDQKAFFVADVGEARIISNGWQPRQDRARVGAGKTDAAEVPPAKSSGPAHRCFPLEYHIAKHVLAKAEDDRVRLSALNWALSEALRNFEQGKGAFGDVQEALSKLSIAIA